MKTTQMPSKTHRELDHGGKREQKSAPQSENTSCESALREAGIDERLIAKKLKEQLEAKQPRWNPKRNAFDLFPNYGARLAALTKIVEILGGFPTENGEGGLIVVMDGMSPKRPRPERGDLGERGERFSPDLDEHRAGPNEPLTKF